MKTQMFKAKDMKSAMNLVNNEFGEKAIILSTKKNNGAVEIEASDNDVVIETHKKRLEEKKNFSNVFMKEIDSGKKNAQKKRDNISYLGAGTPKESRQNEDMNKSMYEEINKQLESLRSDMSKMIITDQSGISDELSYFTPIKLRQEKFLPEVVNKLNYSFVGKNLEEGRVSFFRELSRKLASDDFSRFLNSKNIFVFGNSGSGKSTLSAKIASHLSDKNTTKNVNFIDVSTSSTGSSDILRSYSRVLSFPVKDYNYFNFNDSSSADSSINIFDFSGDLNFGVQKIREIKNSFPSFNFCSILALQSGSNSEMINSICKRVADIRPMFAVTKLDECWVGAEEFSSLALNNARVGIVTGTKVLIDSIMEANENSLTKYMKENFKGV
jgi:flagellar biosynthesis GTPase FlhF